MKAWSVSNDEYPKDGASLVFAETQDRARTLGHNEVGVEFAHCAARVLDFPVPSDGIERVATERECRDVGWKVEDEEPCAACGKYAMEMDEFRLCEVCGNCPECGCDAEEHADEESA